MSASTEPAADTTPCRGERAWVLGLALMIAAYVAYFGILTWLLHGVFQTYAYDLGTFDQGIWLAGHSKDLFVTVRGLHLLGDHVRPFAFVLAPLYWIWNDVRALLLAQTVVIAAGAVFVYLLGRRQLRHGRAVGMALCASYLLNPAVQNLNLDHAHPDAFASTFILASLYFLRSERLAAFWLAAALAMSCKEDVPLVYLVLGLVLAARGRRRLGLLLAAASAGYLLLCTQVILPHFNQVGFFRLERGYFWQLRNNIAAPGWMLERLTSKTCLSYLLALGLPVVFAPLLTPVSALPALPALVANLLSDVPYMRSMLYHYATSIVPFLYVATLDTLRRPLGAAQRPRLDAVLAALLLAGAIAANLGYARFSLAKLANIATPWNVYRASPAVSKVNQVLARVPEGAAVSADFSLVPHLSHRRLIYMFPNPFKTSGWGIRNEGAHDPDQVDYIIARTPIIHGEGLTLIKSLVADGMFERVAGDDTVGLYRRIATSAVVSQAACGDFNGDGAVTSLDARRILATVVTGKPCPPSVCDVNGDGAIDAQDATLASRRADGEAVALRCPPASQSPSQSADGARR